MSHKLKSFYWIQFLKFYRIIKNPTIANFRLSKGNSFDYFAEFVINLVAADKVDWHIKALIGVII